MVYGGKTESRHRQSTEREFVSVAAMWSSDSADILKKIKRKTLKKGKKIAVSK